MKRCIILILTVLFLCGCGSEEKQEFQSEETLWFVEGEDSKGYLPEDCSDVEQVKALIAGHCNYVDNRSKEEQFLEKEMNLYTEEFKKSLENSGYKKNVADMYENNGLSLEAKEIIWYPSTFDEKRQYCKVTIDSAFIFTQGNDTYLEKNQISLDTLYTEQRVYYLEKEQDEWKISNINKSVLEKQDAA